MKNFFANQWPSIWRLIVITGLISVYFALCQIWYAVYNIVSSDFPPVYSLQKLSIKLKSSASPTIVGYPELLQNLRNDSAEKNHIRISQNNSGQWEITNSARERKLALAYSKAGGFISTETRIADGDSMVIGGVSYLFSIPANTSGVLNVKTTNRALPTLRSSNQCGFRYFVKRVASKLAGSPICQILTIGGEIDYLGDETPAWGSDNVFHFKSSNSRENAVRIYWKNPHFVLKLGSGRFVQICRVGLPCYTLGRQPWPLASKELGNLTRITIGRTGYNVIQDAEVLTLTPASKPHWILEKSFNDGIGERRISPTENRLRNIATKDGGKNPEGILLALIGVFFASSNFTIVIIALIFAVIVILYGLSIRRSTKSFFSIDGIGAIPIFIGAVLLSNILLKASIFGFVPGNQISAIQLLVCILVILYPVRWAIAYSIRDGIKFRTLGQSRQSFNNRSVREWSIWSSLLAYSFFLLKWIFTVAVYLGLGAGLIILSGALNTPALSTDVSLIGSNEIYSINVSLIGLFGVAMITFLIHSLINKRISIPLMLLWFSFTVLAAAGVLNILQLTFGHEYAAYLKLYRTHLAVIGSIAFFSIVVSLGDYASFRLNLRSFINGNTLQSRIFYATLTILICLFVGIWGIIGTETGLAGMQPSELAKSMLSILFALLAAIALKARRSIAGNLDPARIYAPIVAFGLIFAVTIAASAALSDFSPILIQLINITFVTSLVLALRIFSALGLFTVGFLLIALITAVVMINNNLLLILVALVLLIGILLVLATSSGNVYHRQTLRTAISGRLSGQFSKVRLFGKYLRGLTEGSGWLRIRLASIANNNIKKHFIEIAAISLLIVLPLLVNLANNISKDEKSMLINSIGWSRVPVERLMSWKDISFFDKNSISTFPDLGLQAMKSRVIIAKSGCALLGRNVIARDKSTISLPIGNSIPLISDLPEKLRVLIQGLAGCRNTIELRTGKANQDALAVPAVQDDFIASFFLHTFGRDSAVLLVLAQAILVISMISSAFSAVVRGWREPRDFDVGVILGLAIAGFAAILSTQFFLSWANVFGALPVVGQPMTFLSMGGSHHIFLGLPAILSLVFVEHVLLNVRTRNNQLRRRAKLPRFRILPVQNVQLPLPNQTSNDPFVVEGA